MAIIKTSTFPKGPVSKLDKDDIVQLLQGTGRFRDCYVGALIEGDEYYAPAIQRPRTDSELLGYLTSKELEIERDCDIDGKVVFCVINDKWGYELFASEPHEGWLAEGLNYLMDQDEGLVG